MTQVSQREFSRFSAPMPATLSARDLGMLQTASLDAVRGALTLDLSIELGLLLRPAR